MLVLFSAILYKTSFSEVPLPFFCSWYAGRPGDLSACSQEVLLSSALSVTRDWSECLLDVLVHLQDLL